MLVPSSTLAVLVGIAALLASVSAEEFPCHADECLNTDDEAAMVQLRNPRKTGVKASKSETTPMKPVKPKPVPKPVLHLGTPLAGYHNATLHVYAEAMKELGYTVKLVFKYIHPQLYPMFTGFGGTDAGCKKVGCADLCEESGLGTKSPCIDFVVDSNLPVNHASYLEPYQNVYDVMGTAFESEFIGLFVPDYSGAKSITDASTDCSFDKTIVGFKGGGNDHCGTLFCPKCGEGKLPYITGPPLSTNGFTYESFSCPDFEKQVAKKLEDGDKFIVLMWTPMVWGARFPQLVPLDLEEYQHLTTPNVGKAQIRKAARHKFSDKALSVLGAIFIGTEDVKQMDGWSHGFNNNPAGQLCEYESWDHACSEEAAQKWIRMNKDNGTTKGVWETFFW